MKRKHAEWSFEELLQTSPEDVETCATQIDEDTIVLQIRYPADWDHGHMDALVGWVKQLRKSLPENVYVLTCTKEMEVDFQRPPIPKNLKINFVDCAFRGEDIWNKIQEEAKQISEKDLVTVDVNFQSCTFDNSLPAPIPPPPTQLTPKSAIEELHTALSTTMGRPSDPPSVLDEAQVEIDLHKIISKGKELKSFNKDD